MQYITVSGLIQTRGVRELVWPWMSSKCTHPNLSKRQLPGTKHTPLSTSFRSQPKGRAGETIFASYAEILSRPGEILARHTFIMELPYKWIRKCSDETYCHRTRPLTHVIPQEAISVKTILLLNGEVAQCEYVAANVYRRWNSWN